MDCSTARLFLQLGRPGARELEAREAADLEDHLTHCSICHVIASDQARFDQHMATTMQAVEVPRGLREEILLRLDADSSDRHRRYAGKAVRIAVGLLALVVLSILGFSLFALFGQPHSVVPAHDVVESFNYLRPDIDQVNAQLKRLGARPGAPSFVNYAYLSGRPAVAILPGTEEWKTPIKAGQLSFLSPDKKHRAFVYIVPRKEYRIEEMEDPQLDYRLDVYRPGYSDQQYTYFILHTGKNASDWDWLKAKE
jgi:hypothetical protein